MSRFTATRDMLEAAYPKLSPQLRAAARFALKEPTQIALYPLRRVASSAGVSPATLVRLAEEIGYSSYNEFRDDFRSNIHASIGIEKYAARAESLYAEKHGQQSAKAFDSARDLQLRNISELFETISAEEAEAAGETLSKARRIYVLGMRANFVAAFYFDYVLKTFSRKSVLLEDRMGMLIDELGDIGAEDAMLALSSEPYAANSVQAVRYAVNAGAQVVAVTDNSVSPIAEGARHVFVVPTVGLSFFQSQVPKLALVEYFISILAAHGGKAGIESVKQEFARRDRFGVYWKDRSRD